MDNSSYPRVITSVVSRARHRLRGPALRFRLRASGVWFVGWSETVGGGDLWWEAVGRESGCIAAVGSWETWDVDKWRQDDVGDGRDAG
jgi:hypothetical protein